MASKSSIRIIGGKWRSRKVHFNSDGQLRPTPDRVRETLFNWLQNDIVNSKCLDLYAGSGVLGLESLSRGASSVLAVELTMSSCNSIQANVELLEAQNYEVINSDVLAYLGNQGISCDIVFVDPPYNGNLLAPTFKLLESNNWLRSGSYIYFECGSPIDNLQLPKSWELYRNKKAGNVYYNLLVKE